MPTDLIPYIFIVIVIVGFIKRVGEVCSVYERQPVESVPKN